MEVRSARWRRGGRQQGRGVSVFVGVDVGDVYARALEFLELRYGLAFNIVFADFAAGGVAWVKVDDAGAEGLGVASEQGRGCSGDGR